MRLVKLCSFAPFFFFLDKDMHVNTGLFTERKENIEMTEAFSLPQTVQKDFTQQLDLFLFFNPLLQQKGNTQIGYKESTILRKRNRREGKPNQHSSFLKRHVSCCQASQEGLHPWCYISFVWTRERKQSGEHAGRRVTRLTEGSERRGGSPPSATSARSFWTFASRLRRQNVTSKKRKEKDYKKIKGHFIFHKSLCIFHNILFLIIILINTKQQHCGLKANNEY